jgi:hypothetical protein
LPTTIGAAHCLLVSVARDPDLEQLFREFVAGRSPALQRTAYLLVGDWGLAEDLVQTALIKTYLAARSLGGVAAFEPYARRFWCIRPAGGGGAAGGANGPRRCCRNDR